MRGGKRLWTLAGTLVLLIASGIAATPLWFPWAAPLLMRSARVRYGSYRRVGWTRFELSNVRWEKAGSVIAARSVESLLPTAWLWDKFWHPGAVDFLLADGWICQMAPGSGNSTYQATQNLFGQLKLLARWVPQATLRNGAIRLRDQEITVPEAQWREGALHATLRQAQWGEPIVLDAQIHPNRAASIQVHSGPFKAKVTAALLPQTLNLGGVLAWRTNDVEVSAIFGRMGSLPLQGLARTKSFSFPAEILRLKGYDSVQTDAEAHWETNHFTIDLKAGADSLSLLPAANLLLHAEGDTNHIHIDSAHISAQGLQADLSPALDLTFQGKMLTPAAMFRVNADLALLLREPASGQVAGYVSLRREAETFPDLHFNLASTNVEVSGITTTGLDVDGRLLWPRLELKRCRVQFAPAGVLDLSGEADLPAGAIETGKLHLEGVPNSLPKDVRLGALMVDASFSGPFTNVMHSGAARLTGLQVSPFAPLSIEASWHSQRLRFDDFQAAISAGHSTVKLAGAGEIRPQKTQITLRELTLKTPREQLALTAPFTLLKSDANNGWELALSPLQWRGTNRTLDVTAGTHWPQTGTLDLMASNISPVLFQDFFTPRIPSVDFDHARASVNWSNGPAVFSCDLAVDAALSRMPFRLKLSAGGDEHGIALRQFSLDTQGTPLVQGSGQLPTEFFPARGGNFMQVNPTAPLQVRLHTEPNPAFWTDLTHGRRLALNDPAAQVTIDGTLNDPHGTVSLSAHALSLIINTNIPALLASNLEADVDLSPELIKLQRAQALFRGQPFSGGGELPIPHPWPRTWRKALDWRKARLWLRGQNLQLAAFTQLAPQLLAPQGMINIDLSSTNGQTSGHLNIRGGQTVPLPDTGAVQNIEADIDLAGTKVTLAHCSGTLGGGVINMSGTANLARYDTVTQWPIFTVEARAQNVPLSRTASLILRTGFNLKVSNQEGGAPVVSGFVTLGKSYFLADPNLLTGHTAIASERPPFFSINERPFAAWRLNVQVDGTKFLSVESPFFNGEVSAGLHLTGTLAQPVALGNVKLNSGEIDFPFANMQVTQGTIYLTVADPYEPHLFITAAGRAYSYDIHLQVSGPASHPELEFSSTPGLPSEQILLMLTTGEMPVNAASPTTEQRASRVGMFVGKNTLSQLGIFSGGEERLTFGTGEAFGELTLPEEVLETYSAEYKLTRNWWLIGEYDPFGVSLGLKWRFYAR